MAKVQYSKNVPRFDSFGQLDGKTLKLTELTGSEFTLEDADGTSIVFAGRNFDRTQGVVTGGTITGAEFLDDEGEVLYTFDGLGADAQKIYKAFTLDKNPLRIIDGLMAGKDIVNGNAEDDVLWGFGGNDKLFGRAGDDFLYGHRGNDRLTGGLGADTFLFVTGYDQDTVTDFDLTGADHDFIRIDYFQFDEIIYSESNGNVTLTLPTGDSLTLLDVTQAQIEGRTKFFDFY